MKILKLFNNNIVSAMSEELGEIIVAGSGIGFKKKIGDEIDESKIEKTYTIHEQIKQRFNQFLREVPTIYLEITERIVNKAGKDLDTEFSSEVFISISDHIAFAVKRKEEGMFLPNMMLNETKTLYKKEYEIGVWALKYIKAVTGVQLDIDEAGFIALHLVNFSIKNNHTNGLRVVVFTKDILKIIQDKLIIELKESSLGYARLSTHLKYLAERILRNELGSNEDTTSSIREIIAVNPLLIDCVHNIKEYILKQFNYEISPDEETYLCIHIKNNMNRK